MSETKTVLLTIPEDLARAFPVVKELRANLDLPEFTRLTILAAAADGYKLVAREVKAADHKWHIVAVMGYRILHDLVHGSHLYVDDLVTSKDYRSQGHGAELLRWAEGEARRLGLSGLRLCSGVDNKDAHRFYEREGWSARSLAFKKKVPNH